MVFYFVIFSVLFYGISLTSFCENGINRTKAFRSMEQKEQDKYNMPKLNLALAVVFAYGGTSFLLGAVSEIFRNNYFVISFILWLVLMGILLYLLQKTKCFFIDLKKKEDSNYVYRNNK